MSIPAVEPQFLPAGKSPQFWVTLGAGLGKPSPEIGLPAVTQPVSTADTQAKSVNLDSGDTDDEIMDAPWIFCC
jgi:hypothetical protein